MGRRSTDALLVVLVASALWLLLRPPLPTTEQGEQHAPDAPDADDPTESLGHPDVRVADPHHGDERALRH